MATYAKRCVGGETPAAGRRDHIFTLGSTFYDASDAQRLGETASRRLLCLHAETRGLLVGQRNFRVVPVVARALMLMVMSLTFMIVPFMIVMMFCPMIVTVMRWMAVATRTSAKRHAQYKVKQ